MSSRVWQCGALLSSVIVASAAAQPAAAPSARALVAQAGDALGSPRARLQAARFAAEQRGTTFAGEQARLPSEAVANAGRVYRWRFDAPSGTVIREGEQHFPGGVRFWTRAALAPRGGWQVDVTGWRTGTDLQRFDPAATLRSRLQFERSFPHLLIRQAEIAPAGETVSADAFRYRDAAGDTIEVTLDPVTRLPRSARQIGPGPATTELLYSDYRRRHGVLMPHRLQTRQGERVGEEVRLGATRLATISETELAEPAGYTPPPPPGEPAIRELAPGVLYFDNMPIANHSMAVDLGDHLLLIESPSSPEAAAIQRRLLEQARPGKSVRYVLVTHHHGDHAAGLSAWLGAGATLVVPQGARVAIERQLRARNYQGEIRIEEVADRRSFGSGSQRVDAYSFASSHAAAHMIMHLPEHRILFQGDLFYLPERGGPPPAFPVVRELANQIARRGLAVDWIVGVHGRPGTWAEFRESLRRGRQ